MPDICDECRIRTMNPDLYDKSSFVQCYEFGVGPWWIRTNPRFHKPLVRFLQPYSYLRGCWFEPPRTISESKVWFYSWHCLMGWQHRMLSYFQTLLRGLWEHLGGGPLFSCFIAFVGYNFSKSFEGVHEVPPSPPPCVHLWMTDSRIRQLMGSNVYRMTSPKWLFCK